MKKTSLNKLYQSMLAGSLLLTATSLSSAATPEAAQRSPFIQGINFTNSAQQDMVWIKPGELTNTKIASQLFVDADRYSPGQIHISQGYYIAKTEVTQAQWLEIMGNNPSRFQGDLNRPVENVSKEDAMEYCARLTKLERELGILPANYEYRLPTEQQWEYAARAGSPEPIWVNVQTAGWVGNARRGRPQSVATKLTNPFGLHDMIGNVYEWCLNSFSGQEEEGVVRGGSWNSFVTRDANKFNLLEDLQTGSRTKLLIHEANSEVGFRPALVKTTPSERQETFVNELGQKMIWVEKGTMEEVSRAMIVGGPGPVEGSNRGTKTLDVTQGYFLASTETTQAQFEAVMGYIPRFFDEERKGDNLPVAYVNWNEAKEFARRLTKHEQQAGTLPEGYRYDLPTDLQWEWAARALNDLEPAGGAPQPSSFREDVDLGQPNGFGFYGMFGGVPEWCLDGGGNFRDSRFVRNPSVTYNSLGWVNVNQRGRKNLNFAGKDLRGIGFRVALVADTRSNLIPAPFAERKLIDRSSPAGSAMDVLRADGRFTKLVAALEATGLDDTANGGLPFTLFAPTDEAFNQLPAELKIRFFDRNNLRNNLDDRTALRTVLSVHVAVGEFPASMVTRLDSIRIFSARPGMPISQRRDGFYIQESKILETDLVADNAIIHVIDKVLDVK